MAPFRKRERKRKVRDREKKHEASDLDTNVAEILPGDQVARKRAREEEREALRLKQPRVSGKKRKRLDKYIETKLKKEQNLELLKRLGGSNFDTTLLRSSKDLGSRVTTRRSTSRVSSEATHGSTANGLEASSSCDEFLGEEVENASPVLETDGDELPSNVKQHTLVAQPEADKPSQPTGVGLKRPLEMDKRGNPILKKRQRVNIKAEVMQELYETSWDGFSSDVSSNQSSASGEDESFSSESELDLDDTEEEGLSCTSDEGNPVSLFASGLRLNTSLSRPKPRANSDFKAWATQQINEARDFTPSAPIVSTPAHPQNATVKSKDSGLQEQDPLPQELQVNLNTPQRKVFSVQVNRSPDIQEARQKLPIVAEEQKIMEAIHSNPVTVVCGATGSGKTTQVVQFLFEAGYGNAEGPTPGICGITQPRRVAAVTMAKRVGEELCNVNSSSYQIRFDSSVNKQTAIKFMTDGILVREISEDFALSKYSVIIIDEAHERTVNTDLLIGMVSRIVELRDTLSQKSSEFKPLKLVIMSATLMTKSFLHNPRLFSRSPPLVESEGRQYPVTIHFSRRTPNNHSNEALRKIVKGHRQLPPGAMLVFLTGQNEIVELARELRSKLSTHQEPQAASTEPVKVITKDLQLETDDVDFIDGSVDIIDSDLESGDEDEENEFMIESDEQTSTKALILPLYAQLPSAQQLRVFESPPKNTRLIVLATNIAETSITIPSVRYVFDCGKCKEKIYDNANGVSAYQTRFISKASAAQRAGRAGRTGPGHCYRLYSSAFYERFPEHTDPEILRTPVEGVVLQLKSMDLQHTANFPFPTPPDKAGLVKAEKLLAYLGALDNAGKITPLGRDISAYPLSPRYGKMLAIGSQHECLNYTVAIVASLAVPELFIPESQLNFESAATGNEFYSNLDRLEDTAREKRKQAYNKAHSSFSAQDRHSDALKLLSAFCAYKWASKSGDADTFSTSMFLRPKAMQETMRLYQQLIGVVALSHPDSVKPQQDPLTPPGKTQLAALKQIVAASFIDQVAIRADLSPQPPEMPRNPKRTIDVPYLPLLPIHTGRPESLESQAVYIHPSSILAHTTSPKDLPQYLIYSTLQRSTPSTIAGPKTPKTRMHPLTPVTGVQLAALAKGTPLLEYGKPIGKIQQVEGERDKRMAWVIPSLVGENEGGRNIWPLPAVKVLQKRDGRGEWVVERVER